MFNAQDDCVGSFWQTRFGCERLDDDAALLVCSLYVNINPIRAGIAGKPEESRYTSAYERMQDRMSGDPRHPSSSWLSAVQVDGDGYDGVAAKRRASNRAFWESRSSSTWSCSTR